MSLPSARRVCSAPTGEAAARSLRIPVHRDHPGTATADDKRPCECSDLEGSAPEQLGETVIVGVQGIGGEARTRQG